MKQSIFLANLLLISITIQAQLPGKKFKTPYTNIDGHEYKVGEIIKLGMPSKGKQFEQIATYKKISFLETVGTAASLATSVATTVSTRGAVIPSSNVKEASNAFAQVDNSFSNQEAEIQYFSFYEPKNDSKNNSTFVVAKMIANPAIIIAFNMQLATQNGEMYSNNVDYRKVNIVEQQVQSDTTSVTQFSSKIHTQYLSAVGSKDKQTVTLNFLLSHKSVHQVIRIRTADNSGYDLEGNEYKSSNVYIGSVSNTYSGTNKIPTGVPVKVSITFNKILPNVKLLRYVTIKIYYDDEANGNYPNDNAGSLEVKNVKINWL